MPKNLTRLIIIYECHLYDMLPIAHYKILSVNKKEDLNLDHSFLKTASLSLKAAG